MKTKAVGYVRISKDREGQSIQGQKDSLRSFCDWKGLELVDVIEEVGVSASIPFKERKGGKKALALLSKGEASCLVGHKLDRLFRDVVDCLTQIEELEKENKVLHIIDMRGSSIDTSSATGKLFVTMVGAFAEFERNRISERIKESLAVKKKKGERVGGVPYGCSLEKDGKTLIDNPEEKKIIKEVLKLKKKGFGSKRISKALKEKGIFSRSGKPFFSTQILRIIKDNQS